MILVGVDIGGTFTDLILFDDSHPQDVQFVKVSTTTRQPEKGVVEALRNYENLARQASLLVHATTIATNALLTRTGLAKTALITNQGFRDILEIGRQRRPELYDLKTRRPVPLVKRRDRLVVRGRVSADGSEIEPLNKEDLRRASRRIMSEGFESVAIVFLNSYVNPEHEREAENLLRKSGFQGHIDISSDVDRQYREYERTSTTVVNAVLKRVLAEYLSRFERELKGVGLTCPVYVMNSDGTSSTISNVIKRPISIIESGPAAGVLSGKTLASALKLHKVITFDMGGTTAKAGIVTNGKPELGYEFEAAGKTHSGRSVKGSGYPVRQPFLDLAEVSSGGGTIAWVDEARALHAGPQSAAAEPGPAAYGRGGKEPTVTDANIILGRINPDHLLGGALKLHHDLALKAITDKVANRLGTNPIEAAQRIIKIVEHNMARAISLVIIERGRDPRDFTMISFGGAGPLHSTELAEELGINRIIVPQHPGLFSALGLLTADLSRTFIQPVMRPVTANLTQFFKNLETQAKKSVENEGFASYELEESVDLRYQGQSYELTLPYDSQSDLIQLFNAQHNRLYGYSSDDTVEAVNARVSVKVSTPKAKLGEQEIHRSMVREDSTSTSRKAWLSGEIRKVPVYAREKFLPGVEGKGPCIIEEYDSTTVISHDWNWRIDEYGNIDLNRKA